MSTLLSIDTSTEACSVALLTEGAIYEQYVVIPRKHADQLLQMIQALLQEHGQSLSAMDAIAFGRGPGSFTGLRIAAGVAQGLAFGLDIPVLPVSTLAALAWQAYNEHGHTRVVSCLDARIAEVYWAAYAIGPDGLKAIEAETLCAPGQMRMTALKEEADADWFGAGNGWQLHEQMTAETRALVASRDSEALPRAAAMAELALLDWQAGRFTAAEEAAPIYLRDKVTR